MTHLHQLLVFQAFWIARFRIYLPKKYEFLKKGACRRGFNTFYCQLIVDLSNIFVTKKSQLSQLTKLVYNILFIL